MSVFGLGPISGLFSGLGSPYLSGAGDLARITASQPVVYTRGKDVANLGGAVSGAGNGAITGGSFGGGWGALIGGVVGGIGGLFSKKPAQETSPAAVLPAGGSAMPSLTDALSLGLGSLGRSRGAPVNVNQSQNVDQATNINLTNIIGGREFGGTDLETGDFDVFKTISDVFAIQDAMKAAQVSGTTANTGAVTAANAPATAAAKSNLTNYLVIGALAVAGIYLFKKGK